MCPLTCDKSTRRANQFGFSEIVSSPVSKNIPIGTSPKSLLQLRPSHPTRGASAVVAYVAVRGGGRGCHEDERGGRVRRSRVVRRPKLASSLVEMFREAMVAI